MIFDKWCSGHECSNCFLWLWKKRHLSVFAIFSINHITGWQFLIIRIILCHLQQVSGLAKIWEIYYFQKNASKIRGLMYWLNRQMLLDWRILNILILVKIWELKGIREDKSSLRPVELKKNIQWNLFRGALLLCIRFLTL